MFERLSEGFGNALRKLSGKGTLTEGNVREAIGEVRTALLEADVHFDVVKEFCDETLREALGREVTKSLRPGEEMIGVVHDRLVALMTPPAGAEPGLPKVAPPPTVVMLCGLQGSGKTTTCGKLAAYLKKRGRSCMVAAADLQRPAAVEQLQTVVEQVRDDAPGGARVLFYGEPDKCAEYGRAVGVAVDVCRRALADAKREGVDVLILDTAGRLHVNDDLMKELQQVRHATMPHQILLIVDAMTGQDAVNSAKAFHERLEVDGVILTKFDSDTRGGAALSVRRVTGAPIKFLGVGEKLDALEEFHAERVAGRILGMGDVVSLVEKAREQVSDEEAEALAERMAEGQFTMDDFLKQMRAIRRMGPMKQLLGLIPGVGAALKDAQIDEKQFNRVEGMINSMTPQERRKVSLINNSRRKRIAAGASVEQKDVSQLTKQFEMISAMSKQMAGMGLMGKAGALKDMSMADPSTLMNMPGMGGLPKNLTKGLPGFGAKGNTQTQSPKAKYKKRKR
ncbi:MAG: signal recognition particle protein [Phycisphaeraceae bacterium]|nr:signal recognition particle protein [Phycisphaeraceae bacterium]